MAPIDGAFRKDFLLLFAEADQFFHESVQIAVLLILFPDHALAAIRIHAAGQADFIPVVQTRDAGLDVGEGHRLFHDVFVLVGFRQQARRIMGIQNVELHLVRLIAIEHQLVIHFRHHFTQ
ncbi:hypothetical protein SDC9_198421 [bioreactor metagenome]|uniref:Uncharacterized protein n=1 Tax=bioreactor metagenome TaxID=1076179 RepID=A0A645IHL4_9ZZZZ